MARAIGGRDAGVFSILVDKDAQGIGKLLGMFPGWDADLIAKPGKGTVIRCVHCGMEELVPTEMWAKIIEQSGAIEHRCQPLLEGSK